MAPKAAVSATAKLGKDLAIDRQSRLIEAIDQTAVGQTIGARCRINACDPYGAKLALLRATVAVGVLSCFDDGLFGAAIRSCVGRLVTLRLT